MFHIRSVTLSDAQDITDIYNYYIAHTVATFEECPVDDADMADRIRNGQYNDMPWFVAQNDQEAVIGYAYATAWKARSAYRFSVEITVYVHPDQGGKGIGSALYDVLFSTLKMQGFHSVLGGITLPNAASIALHEKFGLKKVGHLEEVGFKFGRWVDVGYWQGKL